MGKYAPFFAERTSMSFIDRLIARVASSYESMDFVAWLFLHYFLVMFFLIVMSKLTLWAFSRLTKNKRRVLRPMASKRH